MYSLYLDCQSTVTSPDIHMRVEQSHSIPIGSFLVCLALKIVPP